MGQRGSSLLWGHVCRALVAPREVSGRLGETLSVQCWYARGYERYNKYWCRGASRDSCRKVVETAGLEAPQRRGRVSITDKQVFCVILLTVEHLSEEDAGSYWCGIERLGKDIMEPVKVAVFPGKSWRHAGLSFLDQEPPLETTLASSQQGGSSNPATPVLTQYKPAWEGLSGCRGSCRGQQGGCRTCREPRVQLCRACGEALGGYLCSHADRSAGRTQSRRRALQRSCAKVTRGR
uniref:Immunoglobulin domain-containing protein n=1 Tax=Apteryx owenii TaxID=8824 RepID=A0A8B9QDE1_APTOW